MSDAPLRSVPLDQYRGPVGADVVLVEETRDADKLPCIKPTTLYVNGTDVGLIKPGSIVINPGSLETGDVASVTVTLMVRSLTIQAKAPQ